MSFFDALFYPYRTRNKIKIILIALILSAIPFVNILFGVIFTGYSLRLLGQLIRRNNSSLPDYSYWEDFKRGWLVNFASLLYFLPFILLMAFSIFGIIVVGGNTFESNPIPVLLLVIFVGILLICILIISELAYFVALIRYAENLRMRDLFNPIHNIRKALSWRAIKFGFGLVVRQVYLGSLYFSAGMMLQYLIIVAIAPRVSSPLHLYIAIFIAGLLTAIGGFLAQFSNLYLAAGYGRQLGFGFRTRPPRTGKIAKKRSQLS